MALADRELRAHMSQIKVISQKYDGSLRDEGASYLYHADETTIITVTRPGTPYFHHKKGAWFTTEDGSIDLYFTNKWYNVWHICEQHSGINRIYANIALPATLQADGLRWVDLDLDLRVHLDGSLEVLDEDEFVENSYRFAYTAAFIAQARAAVDELVLCYKEERFPFNHSTQVMLYEQIMATMFLER